MRAWRLAAPITRGSGTLWTAPGGRAGRRCLATDIAAGSTPAASASARHGSGAQHDSARPGRSAPATLRQDHGAGRRSKRPSHSAEHKDASPRPERRDRPSKRKRKGRVPDEDKYPVDWGDRPLWKGVGKVLRPDKWHGSRFEHASSRVEPPASVSPTDAPPLPLYNNLTSQCTEQLRGLPASLPSREPSDFDRHARVAEQRANRWGFFGDRRGDSSLWSVCWLGCSSAVFRFMHDKDDHLPWLRRMLTSGRLVISTTEHLAHLPPDSSVASLLLLDEFEAMLTGADEKPSIEALANKYLAKTVLNQNGLRFTRICHALPYIFDRMDLVRLRLPLRDRFELPIRSYTQAPQVVVDNAVPGSSGAQPDVPGPHGPDLLDGSDPVVQADTDDPLR